MARRSRAGPSGSSCTCWRTRRPRLSAKASTAACSASLLGKWCSSPALDNPTASATACSEVCSKPCRAKSAAARSRIPSSICCRNGRATRKPYDSTDRIGRELDHCGGVSLVTGRTSPGIGPGLHHGDVEREVDGEGAEEEGAGGRGSRPDLCGDLVGELDGGVHE